jgi:hypothetical protein
MPMYYGKFTNHRNWQYSVMKISVDQREFEQPVTARREG